MERPLAPEQLVDYVCAHLWPVVAALQEAGYTPSLALFDIKAHTLTLEYPAAAGEVLSGAVAIAASPELQCHSDSAVCRCCTQSLSLV